MEIIYHLILETDWDAAKATGEARPGSLAAEGFIHCSEDEDQALAVARRLYSGQPGMVLLELDTGKLLSPVSVRPAAPGRFTHISMGR